MTLWMSCRSPWTNSLTCWSEVCFSSPTRFTAWLRSEPKPPPSSVPAPLGAVGLVGGVTGILGIPVKIVFKSYSPCSRRPLAASFPPWLLAITGTGLERATSTLPGSRASLDAFVTLFHLLAESFIRLPSDRIHEHPHFANGHRRTTVYLSRSSDS